MYIVCRYCRYLIEVPEGQREDIVCPSCASSLPLHEHGSATTKLEPHRRLGKFELFEQVGRGGYGSVWRGVDTELGRVVAVKIPHLGRLEVESDVERFLREARATARLRHPGIVAVHEVGH